MIIIELLKSQFNQKMPANFYFWQDSNGIEVDWLIEANGQIHLVEMKNSQTPKAEFFRGLTSFRQAAAQLAGTNTVVYAGADDQERSIARILSWKNLSGI